MDEDVREDIRRVWESLSEKMQILLSKKSNNAVEMFAPQLIETREKLVASLMGANDAVIAYNRLESQLAPSNRSTDSQKENRAPAPPPGALAPDFFDVENLPQVDDGAVAAASVRRSDGARVMPKYNFERGDGESFERMAASASDGAHSAGNAVEGRPRGRQGGGISMLRRQIESNEKMNRRTHTTCGPDTEYYRNAREAANARMMAPREAHQSPIPIGRDAVANNGARGDGDSSRDEPRRTFSLSGGNGGFAPPISEFRKLHMGGHRSASTGEYIGRSGEAAAASQMPPNFQLSNEGTTDDRMRFTMNPLLLMHRDDPAYAEVARKPVEGRKPPGYTGVPETEEDEEKARNQAEMCYVGNVRRLFSGSKGAEGRGSEAAARTDENYLRQDVPYEDNRRGRNWTPDNERDVRRDFAEQQVPQQASGFAQRPPAVRRAAFDTNEDDGDGLHDPEAHRVPVNQEGGFSRRRDDYGSGSVASGAARSVEYARRTVPENHSNRVTLRGVPFSNAPSMQKEPLGFMSADPYAALEEDNESLTDEDDEDIFDSSRPPPFVQPNETVQPPADLPSEDYAEPPGYVFAESSAIGPHQRPPFDRLIDVVLTSVISQKDFSVMLAEEKSAYENLVIQMTNCPAYSELFGKEVETGGLCAVHINEGIYRGRMEHYGNQDCRVFLIDYGVYYHCTAPYVAPLLAEHAVLPHGAILCGLLASFRATVTASMVREFQIAFPPETKCKIKFLRPSKHEKYAYEVDMFDMDNKHNDAFLPADSYASLQHFHQSDRRL